MEEKALYLKPPMWLPVIVALVAGGMYVAGKYVETRHMDQFTISVQGQGKVNAVPDIATLNFGVQTGRQKSADGAMKMLSTNMNKVFDAIKAAGVDEKDIKTQYLSLNPAYDWNEGKRIDRGFEANQSLMVKVRDLDNISHVLDAAVSNGANQAGSVSFTIDDPEELRAKAREEAISDAKVKAQKLASEKDDAALLANSFIASVGSDGKVASNVVATLATALTGWASTGVRKNTAASDFDAEMAVEQPTVVVLTCPGRMRAVYASYLGATLRKLMLDLDTIGERNKGPLPMPVGVILDEFPTLGKLDSLVADVNLVRKRRISILIGAQTKGQFHLIYGQEGTQALFTGLATQVIYGGCDAETAEFYSKASGTATADSKADDPTSHLRQRPLLTVDEVITPQVGNCTVFARYVEAGFATQVILNACLTRFYERQDWKTHLKSSDPSEALLLERGFALSLELPAEDQSDETMYEVMDNAKEAAMMLTGKGVSSIHMSEMRQQRQKRKEQSV